MKSYVLVGFIILAILALSFLSRRERFSPDDLKKVVDIKNRIGTIETKIEESDKKRKESSGTLNSTLR